MIPIYIPSKGRPDFATAKQLNKVESPFTVFVEPQDFKAYSDAGHVSILHLPENNQCIAYARQRILEYAIGRTDAWFWMLDDDIYSFAVKVNPGELSRMMLRCWKTSNTESLKPTTGRIRLSRRTSRRSGSIVRTSWSRALTARCIRRSRLEHLRQYLLHVQCKADQGD